MALRQLVHLGTPTYISKFRMLHFMIVYNILYLIYHILYNIY